MPDAVADPAGRSRRADSPAESAWAIERRLGYPLLQEVAPAPGGGRTLYVVREPLLTDDRSEFVSHLYLAADGADPVQLTFGEHRDTAPRWSPDGRYVAFLSTRAGGANVYCLRADGGEAWALTRQEAPGVRAVEWSPDGRRLALLIVDPPTEAQERARRGRDDARVWGAELAYAHLYVVPFQVGPRTPPAPRRLTRGDFQVVGFDWLPDARRIAFTHRPLPEWDHWWETRLATVTAGEGEGEGEIVDLGLVGDWAARPLASPEGRWVACQTSDRPGKWALSGRVALYPVEGQGAPRELAETPNGKCDPFGWSTAGDALYVLEQAGVATQVWALPVDGGSGRQVTTGTLVLSAPAVAPGARGPVPSRTSPGAPADDFGAPRDAGRGGRTASDSGEGASRPGIACVGQDLHAPNAVFRLDAETGAALLVATPAMPEGWPAEAPPAAEVVRWPSGDGGEIEGVLVYPLEYRQGSPCPLVVEVHGGPPSAFTRSYVLSPERTVDTAALAARGYAVLRPNPRGSTGYGRDFRFANYGDWGGGDLDDVLAGVDWLVGRGIADPARLGIAGWSYGGYLTAAAIARTDRFKAACVGAGIANAVSFNGTADIPAFIPDYLGAEFWDDLERYRRHSPLLRATAIRTPTLILQGEEDERVPPSQGRELHNALRRRGVPVELVLYPRQGHTFGEPRLMLDARRRIVEWLARWV